MIKRTSYPSSVTVEGSNLSRKIFATGWKPRDLLHFVHTLTMTMTYSDEVTNKVTNKVHQQVFENLALRI